MNNIHLSVIIVSFNNLKIITDCLDSINKYNDIGESLEVIIIDNSTNYNIYNDVKKNYRNVRIIKNENKGFGEANNRGVELSKGTHILFLNPDTILIEPIFSFAIEKFRQEKNLALFGVKLLDKDLKNNVSFHFMDINGVFMSQIDKVFNKLNLYIDGKMFILGANIFVDKELFLQVSCFDEEIFMYNEEADLTKRIKKLGLKTAYFKDKRLIHLENQTSVSSVDTYTKRINSLMYYNKKYNIDNLKVLKREIRSEKLKLLIYTLLLHKEKKEIFKSRILILKKALNQ